jgi:hypothetical protein
MLAEIALLAAAALPGNPGPGSTVDLVIPAEPLVGAFDERETHLPPVSGETSKKQQWLREKARRPSVHIADADLAPKHPGQYERPRKTLPALDQEAEARLAETLQPVGSRILPLATLYNLWNREAWPLIPGQPYKRPFQLFLRDHYTKESTWADTRLVHILAAAALRFRSNRVEVVSGYRSPKYNLMLRKKGRQVARESQHLQGTAVDFRVYNVKTEALHEFVRALRLGGVGFYPRTRFVHADTGKVRYWSGS